MTKFHEKKFSVAVGSDAYRDNWDAVFGKGEAARDADDRVRVRMMRAAEQYRYDVRVLAVADPALIATLEQRRDSDCRSEDEVWREATTIEGHRNWTCDRHGVVDCDDCWQTLHG